jgi:mediator of RNA polymerase II transcription subunit 31
MLSNPLYLQHLASQKILDSDDFLAYVDYLQYFRRPEYLPYLQSVISFFLFLSCSLVFLFFFFFFFFLSLSETRILLCESLQLMIPGAEIFRYPGPTLRALELIPQEAFRRDILIPDVVARLMQEGIEASHQMG